MYLCSLISYNLHTLDNGLTLIHHEDKNTPMCVTNILYNVGARDEKPDKTGFAHLFEHLMFGGSENIPSFDTPLQKAGGENNAFTNNDITNYYITIPKENIDTALWLESDRMLKLNFSQKSLDVQKGVVIEEFKQRYLNQPYGDAWLNIRPLSYQVHPYQWATIGKEISHVENATLEEVEAFFYQFYNPNNAIMCIAGNIDFETAISKTKYWFSDIPSGRKNDNFYPIEPENEAKRNLTITSNVPQKAIYMTFKMVDRLNPLYYGFDLLSDILSRSESSRFTEKLVKEKPIFNQISCYITGDINEGLFVIEGKLCDNVSFDIAEMEVMNIIQDIAINGIEEKELIKVKNKFITSNLFAKTSVLNKAMALCYGYLIKNINLINEEIELIKVVDAKQIKMICKNYITENRLNSLYYQPENE